MEATMTCTNGGFTFGQRDGRLFGVDGVQVALVADLRLRDQRDLGAEVRDTRRHCR